MNTQAAGDDLALLVYLRTCEHEYMLVTAVEMARDGSSGAETQQGRGGPRHSISIKPMDLHAFLERLPRDAGLPFVRMEEIDAFQNMLQYVLHAFLSWKMVGRFYLAGAGFNLGYFEVPPVAEAET